MRSGEATTRRTIRRRYARDFAYSEKLLAAAHNLHGLLCNKDVSPAQKCSKIVAVGLWMKICKQYRAILVLSELGLVEDAEVIARSLFESTVQTLFVVKRNIRLRQGWKNGPKPPRGGFSAEFRAKLYLVHQAFADQKHANVWKEKCGLKRLARKIMPAVDDKLKTAEVLVGPAWMAWFKHNKCIHAFRVKTMAGNVGLAGWYDGPYAIQSNITHAGDALNHLGLGSEPMTIDAQVGADIERVQAPLRLANAMCCGHGAHAVNARFGLGLDATLTELTAEAQAVLNGR